MFHLLIYAGVLHTICAETDLRLALAKAAQSLKNTLCMIDECKPVTCTGDIDQNKYY